MKIAELYPERVMKIAIQDENTGLWNSAIVEVVNGLPGPTLYELGSYTYKEDYQALTAIDTILTRCLDSIKVMSN